MDDKTLLQVINSAIGVLGYFDSRAESVEQDGDRIVIGWKYFGSPRKLILGADGKSLPEDL